MSTPFRSARDVIEYMILPYEVMVGEGSQLLKNKASVPLKLAQEHLWTGKDWAGRPLGGAKGAAGNIVSHLTPSPLEDIPRFAMEAWAQENPTYFSEGLAKVFDPTVFSLKVAGMQPRISSTDAEATLLQTKQIKAEELVWGRARKLKKDIFGMSPETRQAAISSVLEDASKAGMDAKGQKSIAQFLSTEGVTRGAKKAAGRYLTTHPEAQRGELAPPPKELERMD
jgi:hypothetical protein